MHITVYFRDGTVINYTGVETLECMDDMLRVVFRDLSRTDLLAREIKKVTESLGVRNRTLLEM